MIVALFETNSLCQGLPLVLLPNRIPYSLLYLQMDQPPVNKTTSSYLNVEQVEPRRWSITSNNYIIADPVMSQVVFIPAGKEGFLEEEEECKVVQSCKRWKVLRTFLKGTGRFRKLKRSLSDPQIILNLHH